MDEREVADLHEFDWLLRLFGGKTQQFGPPGEDFSETVCIMAIPAEGDPVHGIGPEDKHATLLYFGDRSKSADPERIEGSKALFQNVLQIAANETAPFTAKVTGIETLGDEGAKVWLLDSPDLQRLFGEIPEIDSEIHSMCEDADATRYPEYKPHVTIGYKDVPDEAHLVEEIEFDRLSLWWGNEHIDVPLGAGEFDALLEYFGFDPSQPRAADGRWDPGGSGGQKKQPVKKIPQRKPAKEEPKMSKAERARRLVEGVLDALDDVLDDLTSKQAQALIKRIKANAKAFIEGQSRTTPAGGGGGGKKKGDGSGTTPAPSKAKKPKDDGSGTVPAGGGGGSKADGSIEGIIASVQGLLKGFAKNMKPRDRARLKKAVDDLQALDN